MAHGWLLRGTQKNEPMPCQYLGPAHVRMMGRTSCAGLRQGVIVLYLLLTATTPEVPQMTCELAQNG